MPLTTGARLGPYEVLAAIGAGGMGEVWKARDTRLDRIVAIKTIHGPFNERFEREARAISALNHPHICTLHDVGEHDGAGFLVMEFVEGAPLKGPLPLDQALKYAAQICDALDAAHRKGIVHRDLKPDNILLTKAGVKLLDFGLAKAVGPGESGGPGASDAELAATKALTGAHVILGTPQYMAPEQIEGRDADARTDLFAFGCVLYELLTGQKAFEGKTPSSTMAAILATEPRPMRELQPVTPATVERIVKRCLAKDPDDRWQSARDLKAEIEWIASGDAAPSPAIVRRGGASRLPWTVAAALLAALAVSVWVLRRPMGDAAPVAFEFAPKDGEVFIQRPSISPDGRLVALRVRTLNSASHIVVRRLDTLTMRELPGTEGADGLSWSPDSRSLAFVAQPKLKKIDVSSGTIQTLCDFPSGTIPFSAWGRDEVIFTGKDRALWRVPATGGAPTPATTLDASRQEIAHQLPQFLPDGRHFLFTLQSTLSENTGVYAATLDAAPAARRREPVLTGTRNAVFAHSRSGAGYLLFERDGALLAQAFDLDALRLRGNGMPILAQVGFSGNLLNASASHEGSLAYSLDRQVNSRQVGVFDRAGKKLADVGERGSGFSLSMSADEKRLAIERAQGESANIWIVDLAHGGIESRFTFDAGFDRYPLWSPDGNRLVFSASRNGASGLFEKKADGVSTERLLLKTDGPAIPNDWSKDGRRLLYANGGDLWTLTDGTSTRVKQTDFDERGGQFSPDGRWIAYLSNESRRFEVYVQAFPAGARFQISTGGGIQPRWRRDGKELFYVTGDGTLMAVPVQTGVGFEYGRPTPLFTTAIVTTQTTAFGYAPSADGERFTILSSVEQVGSRTMTVLTDWLAGVKR